LQKRFPVFILHIHIIQNLANFQ